MSGKSSIKPMGLRKKPTFNELIEYITHGQEVIKYPNRYFRQLRDSPWLSQIDGEDTNDIEAQQQNQAKIVQRDTIIREVAQQAGTGVAEARVHNHITNNHSHNTYVGNPQPPPSSSSGSQTEHPLKASTGTGTDYVEPPDQDMTPPPPLNTPTVHHSTSYGGGGVNSVITQAVTRGRAVGTASSSTTNPNLDSHNPDRRKGPQVFDMAVDDKQDEAMELQQEAVFDKNMTIKARIEQRSRNRGVVRANLESADVGPETAKRAATAASNNILSAHLDREYQIAQSRIQQHHQSLLSREQAINAKEAHTQSVRARIEAEYKSSQESLAQQKKAHAQASEAKDTEMRTREAEVESQKRTNNLQALNLEVAQKKARVRSVRARSTPLEKPPAPPPAEPPPLAPTEAPRRGRSSSAATVAYPEAKARSRTKEPKAQKHKLESEVATKALDTGIKRATSLVDKTTAKKLKIHEAVDAGIKGAGKIVIGNTIKRVRAKQSLKKGITKATSMVKAKATVAPQPDSTLTVVKKISKPKAIVLPVKKAKVIRVRPVGKAN